MAERPREGMRRKAVSTAPETAPRVFTAYSPPMSRAKVLLPRERVLLSMGRVAPMRVVGMMRSRAERTNFMSVSPAKPEPVALARST